MLLQASKLKVPMTRNDYTSITELPSSLLTAEQMRRFAHRYGYAHTLAHSKRLLEVACGAGIGLNYLAESASHVIGMDYTSSVLAHARQRTNVSLVQADAQRLPFASAHFDLILCFEAIYYLDDYQNFLAESYRLLAVGGKVLICLSNPDWPYFVSGELTTHYPPLQTLASRLQQAGFRDVRCTGIMPITTNTQRQRTSNALRQWVVKSGLLPWLGPVKVLLQQISYGQLYPLPSALDAQWVATWQGDPTFTSLTPLSASQPDRVHRVIYVEGTK